MSTTFLTLTNNVLQEINEPELTSGSFSSSRGIQSAVKTFVNKSINDFYNSEVEWPWLHTEITQDTQAGKRLYNLPGGSTPTYRKLDFDSFRLTPKELITNTNFDSNITGWTTVSGTPTYTSAGNGRLRLDSAEVTQSISTVFSRQYKLNIRMLDPSASGSSITVKIGTTSGGTEISSTNISVTNTGDGVTKTISFTATSSTTYIGFANTTSNNLDIDYVRVQENMQPVKLNYISYDRWLSSFSEKDLVEDKSCYARPAYVYKTKGNSVGLSPVPDQDTYTISYEYYATHTDLSSSTDTATHYPRFDAIVINRAKYYAYVLRSDLQASQLANAEYERGIRRARVESINTRDSMRDHMINFGRRNPVGLVS